MSKSVVKDMTSGNPLSLIVRFAIPLWIGNLFQQLYNVVDSAVVGRYVSTDALASVGAAFSLMNFVSAIIIGMCMGCAVVFSQQFGAGDYTQLKKSISTSFFICLALSITLAIGTIILSPVILNAMQIPKSIYDGTKLYVVVIFAGLPFVFLQHGTANLLRSFGNSKIPLFFLIFSCVLNIGLDLLFVPIFKWGIFGAAFATILSQAFGGIGATVYCLFACRFLNYQKGEFKFDRAIVGNLLQYGAMTALQQSVMNLGILVIQSIVNTFGTSVIAGFTAAVKIEAFAYLPVQDFGNAFGTYVAQNRGAQKKERIIQGHKILTVLNIVFCAVISTLVVVFAKPLMGLFVKASETQVIAGGVGYLKMVAPFYVLIGWLFMHNAFFRGMGVLKRSIHLTVISLGLRIVISLIFAPIFGYKAIWVSISIGWAVADIVGAVCIPHAYKTAFFEHT